MNLLQMVMNKNRANRDIFDLFQKKVLPMDLRMLIWKIALENEAQASAYSKKLNQSRLLTISKLDVQIIKDTEIMVTQMAHPDAFDGTMIFAMKTILSYYEVKKDRILTDYLYLLAIPLVVSSLLSHFQVHLRPSQAPPQSPHRTCRLLLHPPRNRHLL